MKPFFTGSMLLLLIVFVPIHGFTQNGMNKQRTVASVHLMAYNLRMSDQDMLTNNHKFEPNSSTRRVGIELGQSFRIKDQTFFNAHLVYNTMDFFQRLEFDSAVDTWTRGFKDIKPFERTTVHNLTVKLGVEHYIDLAEDWRVFGDFHAGVLLSNRVEVNDIEPLSPPTDIGLDPVPVNVEYEYNISNTGNTLMPLVSLGLGFEKDIEDDFYFRFGARYNLIIGEAFRLRDGELRINDQLSNRFNYALSYRLFQFYLGTVYEW